MLCVWWCVHVWICRARMSYKLLCNYLLELCRHKWHGTVQISFQNVEGKYVGYMESPCLSFCFVLWCNNIHHWRKHRGMSNLLGISFWHVLIKIFNFWNGKEDRVSRNGKKYHKKLKDSGFVPNMMINSYHTWLYFWKYTTLCIEEWGKNASEHFAMSVILPSFAPPLLA